MTAESRLRPGSILRAATGLAGVLLLSACASTPPAPTAQLQAAQQARVGWIYQVLQPDSTRPPHPPVAGIAGVRKLPDLRDSVLDQLSAGAGPESPPP